MAEMVKPQCWELDKKETKREETTNAITSVQHDMVISPQYSDNCKCVEAK